MNNINYKSKYIIELEKNSLFFVFNYTHTLEMLYGVDTSNIYQPHGSIGDYLFSRNKLILGHHKSEYSINPELLGGKYFDMYREFNSYTEKPVEEIVKSIEMQNFLKKITFNKINEVVFYGFSYSKVDEEYIKRIKKELGIDVQYILGYQTEVDKKNAESFAKRLILQNYNIFHNDCVMKKRLNE